MTDNQTTNEPQNAAEVARRRKAGKAGRKLIDAANLAAQTRVVADQHRAMGTINMPIAAAQRQAEAQAHELLDKYIDTMVKIARDA